MSLWDDAANQVKSDWDDSATQVKSVLTDKPDDTNLGWLTRTAGRIAVTPLKLYYKSITDAYDWSKANHIASTKSSPEAKPQESPEAKPPEPPVSEQMKAPSDTADLSDEETPRKWRVLGTTIEADYLAPVVVSQGGNIPAKTTYTPELIESKNSKTPGGTFGSRADKYQAEFDKASNHAIALMSDKNADTGDQLIALASAVQYRGQLNAHLQKGLGVAQQGYFANKNEERLAASLFKTKMSSLIAQYNSANIPKEKERIAKLMDAMRKQHAIRFPDQQAESEGLQ